IIDTIFSEAFTHSWNVPDTGSTQAVVKITDQNDMSGTSGVFTIVSAKTPGTLTVIRPSRGEIITGGTLNYQITWTGSGLTPEKTVELSLDSGLTWKPASGVSNGESWSWNVPDAATTKGVIRITDKNGITGKSGVFTIIPGKPGPGSIVIAHPAVGE